MKSATRDSRITEQLGFAEDEVVCEPDRQSRGVVAKTYTDAVEVRIASKASAVWTCLCAIELRPCEAASTLDRAGYCNDEV